MSVRRGGHGSGRAGTGAKRMNHHDLHRGAVRALRFLVTIPIRVYRYLVSPLLPQTCIYYPSCSHYVQRSVMTHGVLRGLALGVARVFRCSGLFTGGHDPVPEEFSFEVIREGYRAHRHKKTDGESTE